MIPDLTTPSELSCAPRVGKTGCSTDCADIVERVEANEVEFEIPFCTEGEGGGRGAYRDRPNRGGEVGAGGEGKTRLEFDFDEAGGGGKGRRVDDEVAGEAAPLR